MLRANKSPQSARNLPQRPTPSKYELNTIVAPAAAAAAPALATLRLFSSSKGKEAAGQVRVLGVNPAPCYSTWIWRSAPQARVRERLRNHPPLHPLHLLAVTPTIEGSALGACGQQPCSAPVCRLAAHVAHVHHSPSCNPSILHNLALIQRPKVIKDTAKQFEKDGAVGSQFEADGTVGAHAVWRGVMHLPHAPADCIRSAGLPTLTSR
mgnify:CR=1 FL=1